MQTKSPSERGSGTLRVKTEETSEPVPVGKNQRSFRTWIVMCVRRKEEYSFFKNLTADDIWQILIISYYSTESIVGKVTREKRETVVTGVLCKDGSFVRKWSTKETWSRMRITGGFWDSGQAKEWDRAAALGSGWQTAIWPCLVLHIRAVANPSPALSIL